MFEKTKFLNENPSQSNHHIQLDEFRLEIQRRDQEILAMAAKMKTLEEQHQVIFVQFFFEYEQFKYLSQVVIL